MEKRYQVFVSSTYEDLIDERTVVTKQLLRMKCIPAAMEQFNAANEDQWTVIQRIIDQCDYYVLIVAGRYGSIDKKSGKSYTELEYDYAINQGIPVVAFVHGKPGDIPSSKSAENDEQKAKLKAFREKVEDRMIARWTSAGELAGHVAVSVQELIELHPRDGWVRGNEALTDAIKIELLELRARVGEYEREHISPAPAQEELASGTDEFEIFFDYTGFEFQNADEFSEHNSQFIKKTWDELFALFAPGLFGNQSETELYRTLQQEILREYEQGLGGHWNNGSVHIFEPDFEQILIQLDALGLVTVGALRQGSGPNYRYRNLTEHGRQKLMELRAIRKPA